MARSCWWATFVVGIAMLGICCAGTPAIAQACAGDCNQSGSTDTSELTLAVQIALGQAPLASCAAADADGNGTVSVEEITGATTAALTDCEGQGTLVPHALGEVTLIIGTAVIAAGESGTFDVRLDSGGLDVAGIQIDITFDPLTAIGDAGGVPDCTINPATGKSLLSAFPDSNRARFLVLSFSDVNPIPDGILFTCNVNVSGAAPDDTYPLTGSNEGASDPDGNALTTVSQEGAIIVGAASACAPTPIFGCHTATNSKLTLGNGKLSWKWLRGTSTLGDFGYPVVGPTSYTLCIYGAEGGAPTLALGATVLGNTTCGGTFCWKPTGVKGFKYKDTAGASDGITRMRLRAGSGDAQIQVKGSGSALMFPPPADANNLIYQDPNVTVQLRNSDGICWESVFPGPAQRISGTLFVDRF